MILLFNRLGTDHYFFGGGGVKFFQDKQFFSVLLSVQTIFSGCIFLQTILLCVCYYYYIIDTEISSREKDYVKMIRKMH